MQEVGGQRQTNARACAYSAACACIECITTGLPVNVDLDGTCTLHD